MSGFVKRTLFKNALLPLVFAAYCAAPPGGHAASFSSDEIFPEDLAPEQPGMSPGQGFFLPELMLPAVEARIQELVNATLEALRNEDFETAAKSAKELTVRAPGSGETWHLYGIALASLDRVDEALVALDTASDRYELSAEPMIIKGQVLLSVGRRDEAIAAFQAATERDPANWRGQLSLAVLLEEDGKTDEAIRHYRLTVDKSPEKWLLPHLRLAGILVDSGRAAEAVPVLTAYVATDPTNARALSTLGRAQILAQRHEDAISSFSRAIALAPDAPRLYAFRASAEKNAGRFDDAIATLETARQKFPENSDIHFDLGNLFGAKTDYAGAIAAYEVGLAVSPDDPRLLKGVSLANFRMGRLKDAVQYAETLAAREDRTAGDLVWLAVIREQLGDRDAAITAYASAVDMDPDNWLAANNLAALLSESDPSRAVELATRAEQLSDGNLDVRDTLGWAYFNAGDAATARDIFTEIAAARPDSALAAYRLGRAMIETGDTEAGQTELRRALEIDPDFAQATSAREILGQ